MSVDDPEYEASFHPCPGCRGVMFTRNALCVQCGRALAAIVWAFFGGWPP